MNENSSMKLGFIGLGRMGNGISKNIIKAGFDLTVYDALAQKREEYKPLCQVAEKYEDLFNHVDILLLSLPGSPEVEEVVDSFIKSGVKGKLVIDLSTSYPSSSIMLYEKMKANGGSFIDASLSGGPVNAQEGTLNVMAGGEKEVFEANISIFKAFASNVIWTGAPGSGNIIKLASNYLSIMYIGLYAEIIPFIEKLGVDPQIFFDIVSVSGANSKMFQLNAKKMIEENHFISFQLALALKDLSYIKRLFEEHKTSCAILDAGLSIFDKARELELLDKDVSEVVKVTKGL